jgi:hypothetical protein
MDDIVIPSSRGDPQFHYVVAQFGGPSFMRRAQHAEHALGQLLHRLEATRQDWMCMVRLRLGQLHALAGDWERLGRFIAPQTVTELRRLFEELRPDLRVPLDRTDREAVLRTALAELGESIERFNERWRERLRGTDLSEVNRRRDEYNRYYVFEKECVVGSPRIAHQGFRPLEMVSLQHLQQWLPPLPEIIWRGKGSGGFG